METTTQCPSEEALIDMIFGELDPIPSARVNRHVESCAECARALESLSETLEMAGQLPGYAVQPSPRIEAALKKVVQKRQPFYLRHKGALWRALTSPIPAYQAVLGGLAIAFLVQLANAPNEEGDVSAPPVARVAPRAPVPTATTIKLRPVTDVSLPDDPQDVDDALVATDTEIRYAQLY